MADVSGLALLLPDRLDALGASSYGTGEVVRAALDHGCRTVVLGIGGSASTDGGAGMLQALGARLLDADGRELDPGGAALADLARLDLDGLHPALAETKVIVASDVDNPLLGPNGAAAVYGPQKGACAADVATLDAALARWADVVEAAVGGARDEHVTSTSECACCPRPLDCAGPTGSGRGGRGRVRRMAVLAAELQPGIRLVLDLVGFDRHLPDARLVITGRARSTPRHSAARRPPGSPPRPARPGYRSSPSRDGSRCRPTSCTPQASGRPTRSPTSNLTRGGVSPRRAPCWSRWPAHWPRTGS